MTVMMASTLAKIGRSMKKREIICFSVRIGVNCYSGSGTVGPADLPLS
jgi:hypothetical protein